jgi:hypothetical protein
MVHTHLGGCHVYLHTHLGGCSKRGGPRHQRTRRQSSREDHVQELAGVADAVVHCVSRQAFARNEHVAVGDLQLAHVPIDVALDNEADHAVAPAALARRSEESLLASYRLDVLTGCELVQHICHGAQSWARGHAAHNVEDAADVARVLDIQRCLLQDSREALECLLQQHSTTNRVVSIDRTSQ